MSLLFILSYNFAHFKIFLTLTNILYGCASLAVIILSTLFLLLSKSRNKKVLNKCLDNIKIE